MKAVELLEHIQSVYYIHKGVDPNHVLESEITNNINFIKSKQFPPEIEEMLIADIEQYLDELPTKYQSIGDYQILKKIFNELEQTVQSIGFVNNMQSPKRKRKSFFISKKKRFEQFKNDLRDMNKGYAAKNGISIKPLPVFGTVDIGRGFSAYITQLNKDPLIVISGELFPLASVVSNIVAQCFPFAVENETVKISSEQVDWINHSKDIDKHNKISRQFCDYMLALLLHNEPCMTKPEGLYNNGDVCQFISSILIHTFETFIISHEYCHYLLGHPSYALTNIEDILLSDKLPLDEIKQMTQNMACEYEADMYGCIITVANEIVHNNCEEKIARLSFVMYGLYMSFWVIDLLDRLDKIRHNQDDNKYLLFSVTHPEPRNRIFRFKRDIAKNDIVYRLYGVDCSDTTIFDLDKRKANVDKMIEEQFSNLDFTFSELWNHFEECLNFLLKYFSVNNVNGLASLDYSDIQECVYKKFFS